jgi:hypothetical protein
VLTWERRPALSQQTIGAVPAGTKANTPYRVALRLDTVTAAETASLSLAIRSNSDDILRLWSSEHAPRGSAPRLVLTYQ